MSYNQPNWDDWVHGDMSQGMPAESSSSAPPDPMQTDGSSAKPQNPTQSTAVPNLDELQYFSPFDTPFDTKTQSAPIDPQSLYMFEHPDGSVLTTEDEAMNDVYSPNTYNIEQPTDITIDYPSSLREHSTLLDLDDMPYVELFGKPRFVDPRGPFLGIEPLYWDTPAAMETTQSLPGNGDMYGESHQKGPFFGIEPLAFDTPVAVRKTQPQITNTDACKEDQQPSTVIEETQEHPHRASESTTPYPRGRGGKSQEPVQTQDKTLLKEITDTEGYSLAQRRRNGVVRRRKVPLYKRAFEEVDDDDGDDSAVERDRESDDEYKPKKKVPRP